MDKIRILYVGLDTEKFLGGIETYIFKTVNQLNKEYYQIDFLVFKGDIPCFYEELHNLGCCFYFVTKRKENFRKNIREIRKLFQKERFDIVHCHLNSLSYITPGIEAVKAGFKVIVHSHNAGCLQGYRSRILHKINSLRLPRNKLKCVAVSELAGNWMFGERQEFTVINNGVETERFCYSEDKRRRIRDEFGLKGEHLLLHVGAFRTQKNHERLISIFKDYLNFDSQAKLMLVGTGGLLEEIKNKTVEYGISGKVIFAGLRTDVASVMSAADIFLFPSYYEGFPIALLEAESSGLPCIVSDVITKESYIDNLCIPVSLEADNKVWVCAIQKEMRISRVRENCAAKVDVAGFGLNTQTQQLMNLYKSIL